jgi:hypothetical protein
MKKGRPAGRAGRPFIFGRDNFYLLGETNGVALLDLPSSDRVWPEVA